MALYPAVIKSYDPARRKVRIEMVGMTDGDTLLPESDLMYSLGDKSSHTEIEINVGDTVFVDFLCDDPRYPIIMGFRPPEMGNVVGWRRWRHANMELAADGEMILKGKSLKIEFETIETTGKTTNNSEITNISPVVNQAVVSLNAGVNNMNGGAVVCTGGFDVVDGDVVVEGISSKNHTHGGVRSGNSKTGAPE